MLHTPPPHSSRVFRRHSQSLSYWFILGLQLYNLSEQSVAESIMASPHSSKSRNYILCDVAVGQMSPNHCILMSGRAIQQKYSCVTSMNGDLPLCFRLGDICPTATSVQQPNQGFRTDVAVGQESFLATSVRLLDHICNFGSHSYFTSSRVIL